MDSTYSENDAAPRIPDMWHLSTMILTALTVLITCTHLYTLWVRVLTCLCVCWSVLMQHWEF